MDYMAKSNNDDDNDYLDDAEYETIFNEKKRELLLDHNRARVTRMSFEKWFFETYQRDFKPKTDKPILEAYLSGAQDEIENTEFLIEQAELKMESHKSKAIKLADDTQILYTLLEHTTRKDTIPPKLKSLIKKTLALRAY